MRVNQWTRAGVDKNNDTEWKHVRQHEGRQGADWYLGRKENFSSNFLFLFKKSETNVVKCYYLKIYVLSICVVLNLYFI